jgi:biopolymer transport protein ExbD
MSNKKTRRGAPEVNAGSMADIAFLLLIFFLVTTTIAEDQGVLVKLPIWDDQPVELPVSDANVLTVFINFGDRLLIEDQDAYVADIPRLLREHVISPKRQPNQAVVSLTHDRGTSYARYLEVYDALKAGYSLMWDDLANRRFGKSYNLLGTAEQRSIRDEIPLVISEAEPSDVLAGGEAAL